MRQNRLYKESRNMSLLKEPGSRTYGERPRKFQLEEDGDFYYIGSEVLGPIKVLIRLSWCYRTTYYSHWRHIALLSWLLM